MGHAAHAVAALLCAHIVVGCANGAGGGAAPVGAATPSPPPPAPPVVTNAGSFKTLEYDASWAHELIGASEAYSRGATGEDVTVALIDTGVDFDHPELAHAYHPASTDIITERDAPLGPSSHGTLVAGVVAAAKNETGVHGVAFDASIMSVRADVAPDDFADDGCVGTGTTCGFRDSHAAAAIGYAVDNGAHVINMSFGGAAPSDTLGDAMAGAADAGVALVISAGNAGEDAPYWPSSFASDARARGLVIVAGSAGPDGQASDFSNQAGAAADFYLLAPGEQIPSTVPEDADDPDDPLYGTSQGTSMAAPHISAALALLLDAFPGLEPAAAVDILLESAIDIGPEGTDAITGRVLLNLVGAFQPIGETSLSVAGEDVAAAAALAAPTGAFGDFSTVLFDGALIRDRYDRGFTINTAAAAPPGASLAAFEAAALAGRLEARAARTPFGQASFRPDEDSYIALANLETDRAGALSVAVDAGPVRVSAGRGFAAPAPGGGAGGALLSAQAWSGGVAPLAAGEHWTATAVDLGGWSFGARAAGGEGGGLGAAHFARRLGAHELTFE
ncbi:MAG: S8 family serine peptidase, partial [Caulobacterales bacterium]|nr:S8 family serine peptidase [Caulobacterales bacterium]